MTDRQPLDLEPIEARANAATPGPWRLCDDYSDVLNPDGYQLASYAAPADGEFVAHARTDVPAMADEIRHLRATPQMVCINCDTPVGWIDCPTGGWWAHQTHPADGHDADPKPAPATDVEIDTLPAWLAHRFDPRGAAWDRLTDDDRSYWEHQARAVRRAVARGGFKTAEGAQR